MLQHYFVAAWLPTGSDNYQIYSRVNLNAPAPQYTIGYNTTQPVTIAPGESGTLSTVAFVGPKEQNRLATFTFLLLMLLSEVFSAPF